MSAERYSTQHMTATFACKLLLKLKVSEDAAAKILTSLLNHVFEKGYLKKAQNGHLHQGIHLNVYMLILTLLNIESSQNLRSKVLREIVLDRMQFALKSDAAKKNTILSYLQQMWHLMALLMLDKKAQKP